MFGMVPQKRREDLPTLRGTTNEETIIIRLLVAFVDGSIIEEELPNHEAEEIEIMVRETEDDLLVRVEVEDARGNLTYQYKRKTTYAY